MINKGKEILSKLESGFSALMNVIVGKFGHQFSELLKDSLECAICKEVIIEVTVFTAKNQNLTNLFLLLAAISINFLYQYSQFPGPVHTHSATTALQIG